MNNFTKLTALGWSSYFQQQLSLDELENLTAFRVIGQHRSGLILKNESREFHLPINKSLADLTVGDWLLLDSQDHFMRALEPYTLFVRKAAGSKLEQQNIAANVDTAFIVCSLNHDFNLSRIERYLALVKEAQAEAVIVLSKADLCPNPEHYQQQLLKLDPLLMVELVNALDSQQTVHALSPWCASGKTVALIGSSGVGKSTLANAISAENLSQTGSIREDDSKGRHTTTSRALFKTSSGVLILDTPGMRELQLSACETGVSSAFADIEALAQQCRFNDCQHLNQPGCAVINAINNGSLEQRRLNNYLKLQKEQANNAASLAEKRARFKQQTKMYKSIQNSSRKNKMR